MIFRQYLKLIIFFIIFSNNTIASTENEIYEVRKSCLKTGGSWRQFSNSCANNCSENKFNVCSQILIFACDCGVDSCWNESKCIKNTEYNQLLKTEIKREPDKLEKKAIEKNEQDGIYTRKKIMFKIIDQSMTRAQSIQDVVPKKSIVKQAQTTNNTSPSENNANNNSNLGNNTNSNSPNNNLANNDNNDFNFFDKPNKNQPTLNSGNNLKDIYRKIGIIENDVKKSENKSEESSITDSIGSIFDDKESEKNESKKAENKTLENNSKEETKKSSGLLSLLSIDEDKNKDKNKLEIPPPPLFNEDKKTPEDKKTIENKNNENTLTKKSEDKTSKTGETK